MGKHYSDIEKTYVIAQFNAKLNPLEIMKSFNEQI